MWVLLILAFFLGGVAVIFASWIWEHMTGQIHGPLVGELDEYKAAQENQELFDQFLSEGLPDFGRPEIWYRMGWIWKETRAWAVRSGSFFALACLAFFGVLYTGLWLKTLLWPDSHDLRVLLGGRSFFLQLLHRKG